MHTALQPHLAKSQAHASCIAICPANQVFFGEEPKNCLMPRWPAGLGLLGRAAFACAKDPLCLAFADLSAAAAAAAAAEL